MATIQEFRTNIKKLQKSLKEKRKILNTATDGKKLVKILVANSDFTESVISYNRDEQLVKRGIDGEGKKLVSEYAANGQVYSPRTIRLKKKKSGVAAITDRVTLFDTGKSYKTYKVVANGTKIFIKANYIKGGINVLEVWGENVLGLTKENWEAQKPIVEKILYDYFKKELLKQL